MTEDSLPDELQQVIQVHNDKTLDICNSYSDEILATSVPPTIYHYTDDQGIRGILETGKLWFTDLFDLSDPSELNHGIRLALDALKSAVDTGPPEAKAFYNVFRQRMFEKASIFGHFFVCCFSRRGDEIGQWRAYADDGRGYAIGFDADVLEQAFVKGMAPKTNFYSTFPVTYCDKRLSGIHERLVAETVPLISAPIGKNLSAEMNSKFLRSLYVNLGISCLRVSIFFKHEAYSNEQEYRFLQFYPGGSPPLGVQLRSRPYSLVRYREFDWVSVADASLKEIVLGPSSAPELGGKFADDCLREYLPGRRTTPIKKSAIPYRSEWR